jgi:hypothetical protein
MLRLIKYVKSKNIKYSIYNFYIVTEKPLDFTDFRFKVSNYYLKFEGQIQVSCWLNNGFYAKFEKVDEIFKYYFRLKKSKGNITLYINEDEYPLPYKLDLLKYFYKRKENEFFEKDYNEAFSADAKEDDFYESPDGKVHKNSQAWETFKDPREKFKILSDDQNDRLNEGITDEDRQVEQTIDPHSRLLSPVDDDDSKIDLSNNFDFETFYEYYFNILTLNQKKICALLLIGIKITDIARLMETTQVYITLEVRRIAKKIRKLYKKIGKKFWL